MAKGKGGAGTRKTGTRKAGTKKGGKSMLVHFLSDLLKKKSLQRQVAKDPDKTMKAYGLSRDHIKTIKSRSHRKLGTALASEIRDLSRIDPQAYPTGDDKDNK